MTDLDREYRILHLEPGASIREIIESRDDLLYLWDPSRLGERPRLRSRAQSRQAEIQAAATRLIENLSGGNLRPGGEPAASATAGAGPSLYEEVFSKSEQKRSWLQPAVLGGLIVVAIVAALLLLGDETPPLPAGQEEAPATVDPVPAATSPAAPEGSTGSEAAGPADPPPESRPEPVAAQEKTAPPEPAAASPQPPLPAATPRPRAAEGERPVLLRGAPPAPEPAREPAPGPNPADPGTGNTAGEHQEVFDLLIGNSLAARMLAGGRFSDLPFNGWKILEKKGDEFYVDLAVEKEGTTVHFIWGVNLEQKSVHPLSQAARDLEAGTGSPQNPDDD